MSRVRDALKRANTLTPPEAPEAAAFGSLKTPEAFKTAIAWEEFTESLAPSAPSVPAAPSAASSKARYIPLLRHRWIRKLLRMAGVRPPHVPVQRCHGTTRQGQPCRGPAMANGLCRLHGGSRHVSVVEKTRDLLDRVLPAR